MSFAEHDVVKSKSRIEFQDWKGKDVVLPKGTTGAIVLILSKTPPVYEVEFFDSEGNSLGTAAATDDLIEPKPIDSK
ncbi:MAG: DUF4926 domain-containing protein [Acidobacteriota bacterium]|nr:MAG: DUF4926 domain-containing protein [Acidobacteriota bacterium]